MTVVDKNGRDRVGGERKGGLRVAHRTLKY